MIQNLMSRIRDLVDGGGDGDGLKGLKGLKALGHPPSFVFFSPIHTIPTL